MAGFGIGEENGGFVFFPFRNVRVDAGLEVLGYAVTV